MFYSYIPPQSSSGRMCLMQCNQMKMMCQQSTSMQNMQNNMQNAQCQQTAETNAQLAYEAYKDKSDALFNIGAALSAVQLLPIGVYVAMNGKIFSWDNVKKNIDQGIFETER